MQNSKIIFHNSDFQNFNFLCEAWQELTYDALHVTVAIPTT